MTEEKAKKKRCCGPDNCGEPGNPFHGGGELTRWCIGSACMAWRVHYAEEDGNGTEHGFCGLAGKP